MLQVILGVIRCISDFQKLCVSKTAGLRVKDTSRSLRFPVYVVIVFHLEKQSAKSLGFLYRTTVATVNHLMLQTSVYIMHCK